MKVRLIVPNAVHYTYTDSKGILGQCRQRSTPSQLQSVHGSILGNSLTTNHGITMEMQCWTNMGILILALASMGLSGQMVMQMLSQYQNSKCIYRPNIGPIYPCYILAIRNDHVACRLYSHVACRF